MDVDVDVDVDVEADVGVGVDVDVDVDVDVVAGGACEDGGALVSGGVTALLGAPVTVPPARVAVEVGAAVVDGVAALVPGGASDGVADDDDDDGDDGGGLREEWLSSCGAAEGASSGATSCVLSTCTRSTSTTSTITLSPSLGVGRAAAALALADAPEPSVLLPPALLPAPELLPDAGATAPAEPPLAAAALVRAAGFSIAMIRRFLASMVWFTLFNSSCRTIHTQRDTAKST